jgi:hypothetical protein
MKYCCLVAELTVLVSTNDSSNFTFPGPNATVVPHTMRKRGLSTGFLAEALLAMPGD